MFIEVDGRALGVALHDDAAAILKVFDVLTNFEIHEKNPPRETPNLKIALDAVSSAGRRLHAPTVHRNIPGLLQNDHHRHEILADVLR